MRKSLDKDYRITKRVPTDETLFLLAYGTRSTSTFADTSSGRSGPRPERRPTPPDAGSLGGKATTCPNSHRDLSIANPGSTPQEGEVLGISSRRPGPETRDSDNATEGSSKAGTQLGGFLHHRRSGRQGVVHLGRSEWEPT